MIDKRRRQDIPVSGIPMDLRMSAYMEWQRKDKSQTTSKLPKILRGFEPGKCFSQNRILAKCQWQSWRKDLKGL